MAREIPATEFSTNLMMVMGVVVMMMMMVEEPFSALTRYHGTDLQLVFVLHPCGGESWGRHFSFMHVKERRFVFASPGAWSDIVCGSIAPLAAGRSGGTSRAVLHKI